MIKINSFINIAHMQVDVPHAGLGGDVHIEAIIFLDVSEKRIDIEGFASIAPTTISPAGFVVAIFDRPRTILG